MLSVTESGYLQAAHVGSEAAHVGQPPSAVQRSEAPQFFAVQPAQHFQ